MIQKYTIKTAAENRCDEVEEPWDESVDWREMECLVAELKCSFIPELLAL